MATAMSLLTTCVPGSFTSLLPAFGSKILSIDAVPVINVTASVHCGFRFVHPSINRDSLSFCNVTVTYTHHGTDDQVHVETWLPAEDEWNERYYGVGGGGFAAGRFQLPYGTMTGAIAEGYAVSTTDAGLGPYAAPEDASSWVLLGPGNVDLHKVQDFGSVSLNDQAIISKRVIESFYGRAPIYSYWNGCSQGGRQGLMLAQRYPTAYDGIAAGAPALELPLLAASIFWPQQQMNMMGQYPYMCELDTIVQAAVSVCDALDGIVDGVISNVDACLSSFNPFQLVGTFIKCSQTGSEIRISKAAADVVNATWGDVVTASGKKVWHGFNPGADLTGSQSYQAGIAATKCSTSGEACVGHPNVLSTQWLQLFVAKDPNMEFGNLTHEAFDSLIYAGFQEYQSLLGTYDADLSRFRDAGGKMLTFHGLDDSVIPSRGTDAYYDAVTSLLPDVRSFYRYYEVPGLGHCFGGSGGQPTMLFEQLRAWVENGTVPESSPISFTDSNGTEWNRVLCPFPQQAEYNEICGDATSRECWRCAMGPSTIKSGAVNPHALGGNLLFQLEEFLG